MAAGFQAYNSAGVLQIDGTYKPAMIGTYKAISGLTDYGYYQIPNPFGGDYTFGFLPQNFYSNPSCRFVRLAAGQYAMLGADLYSANAGAMMMCTQNQGVSSGYCDVFNGSGALIWSAVSAASVPRLMDIVTIPPGYDLQANTYSVSLSYQPWIMSNCLPGNISDDGTVTGYSGVIVNWTGSQLQFRYVSKLQNSYSTALGSYGLRIPLAYITGY